MNLINGTKNQINENVTEVKYDFDSISSKEELFNFATEFQNANGKIGSISGRSLDENNQLLYMNEYNDLSEMIKKMDDADFKLITTYDFRFIEKPVSMFLNMREKKIIITENKGLKNGDILSEDNYKYYIFDDSLLVRRNMAIDAFYKKNEDEWVEIPRMMDKFIDSAYEFKEVTKEEADNYGNGRQY